jgi:flagellar hook-length control protein FliK
MKIPEDKPKTSGSGVGPGQSKQKKSSTSKERLFQDKMQKKSAQGVRSLTASPFQLQNTPVMPQQASQQDPVVVSKTSNVEVPPAIRNLVQEIQVHVEPTGSAEVRIQFDSRIFDGLRVDITKGDDGGIAINFLAQNENTSQLLSKNIPTLTHALATKGIVVSNIQLETKDRFTSSEPIEGKSFDSGPSPQSSGRQRKRR